jgi:hypothetical protein
MFNNDDFVRWTNEIIAHDLENGELNNILKICEQNFDLWTKELFPVLQQQRKSCYRVVVDILHKGGCMNANEDMVRSYCAYIRKKRGLGKKNAHAVGVAPSLTQTRSVDVVPTSVVVSPVAAPATVVQAPPHQVQATRAAPPKQADEVAHPHVYAKVSLTPPVEFADLREEEMRWKQESIQGWVAPWTGVDEHMWLIFLEKILDYNRYNNPRWTVHGHCAGFRKELGTDQLRNVYDLLKKKVVVQRKI